MTKGCVVPQQRKLMATDGTNDVRADVTEAETRFGKADIIMFWTIKSRYLIEQLISIT